MSNNWQKTIRKLIDRLERLGYDHKGIKLVLLCQRWRRFFWWWPWNHFWCNPFSSSWTVLIVWHRGQDLFNLTEKVFFTLHTDAFFNNYCPVGQFFGQLFGQFFGQLYWRFCWRFFEQFFRQFCVPFFERFFRRLFGWLLDDCLDDSLDDTLANYLDNSLDNSLYNLLDYSLENSLANS